jgi:DNA polymerase (family X)
VAPSNEELADRLVLFATLLELNGASSFTCRAYRRAADLIRDTPAPVADLVRAGRVRELRGVGPGIERRLTELVETGRLEELEELQAEIVPDIVGLGRSLGLSAQRVMTIARFLGLRSADELREAIVSGRVRSVPGVGATTEKRLRAALQRPPVPRKGLTLSRSRPLSAVIAARLGGEMAGDARRYCALSYELAIVCSAEDPAEPLARFERDPLVVTVIERGERNAVGVTIDGVAVTLVVAEPQRLGSELIRATGPEAFVAGLEPLPDGENEPAVFRALGLPWRPPELRDVPDRPVPADLLERGDLRGDLHCHSTWSDGKASVLEMGKAARDLGHEYLAICDHTPNVRVVPGLTPEQIRRQGEEIDRANEQLQPFRLLRGVECDILADGSLDVDDATLAELDWVQASLHAGQRRPRQELTRIVCAALRNPHVAALSHPKGRILNHRQENELDLDAVFEVAVAEGVALEVNGLPDRLDLSDAHAARALEAGARLVLSSDAHSTRGLRNIDLSVGTARRAGAQRCDVVNAAPVAELLAGRRR